MGVMLHCAGEFGHLCEESLMSGLKKSRMILAYRGDLVLSAGSRGKRGKVENRAEDCASVAGKFETCSVQYCDNIHCFGDAGAVTAVN